MKMRKQLKHNLLIQETIDQIAALFKPKVSTIKVFRSYMVAADMVLP